MANAGTTTSIKGYFQRPHDVSSAVDGLVASSIPIDELEVYVVDESGKPIRKLMIRDEPGTRRGAITGAIVGAGLGALVAILIWADVLGAEWAAALGPNALISGLALTCVSAAAGVPIGAAFGMGRWQGRKKISVPSLDSGGSVVVVVQTDELADVARRILRESGAAKVTG